MNGYAEQAYDLASSLNDLYEKNVGVQSYEQLNEEALQQNNIITELSKAVQRYKDEMNKQLANGEMVFGSEEYVKAQTDLADLQAQLVEAEVEIKNINEAIREVNWHNWNNAIKMLEHMNSQLDSVYSIIGDLTAYRDNASITEAGVAQFDLYSSALGNARQQIAEYQVAIETLDKELADGTINQQQYNDELQDYRQKQMSAVSAADKYRKAIVSLVKDGITAETNAMSELIDKRKEDLRRQKEADDYARTIADKTKEINKIRAQITALSGDDTLATQAKIAKLRADLADKEQDLADTRRDHEYSEITQNYDDELDKFKEIQDEKSKALEYSLANQEVAIQSALDYTTSQYQTTYDQLDQIAKTYGINLEEYITTPWTNATSAVDEYKRAVAELATTEAKTSETNKVSSTANNGSGTGITTGNMAKATDNRAKSIAEANPSMVETIKEPWTAAGEAAKRAADMAANPTAYLKSGGKISNLADAKAGGIFDAHYYADRYPDLKKAFGYNEAALFNHFITHGMYEWRSASKFFDPLFYRSKYPDLVKAFGGNTGRRDAAALNYYQHWLNFGIKEKRLGHAAKGALNAKGLYLTDEQGIGSEAIITKGGVLRQLDSDTVFSKAQTEALWKLSKLDVASLLGQAKAATAVASVNNHYDSLLTVNGNVDKDALPGLKEILKQACEYTKRDMTQTFSKMGYRVAF